MNYDLPPEYRIPCYSPEQEEEWGCYPMPCPLSPQEARFRPRDLKEEVKKTVAAELVVRWRIYAECHEELHDLVAGETSPDLPPEAFSGGESEIDQGADPSSLKVEQDRRPTESRAIETRPNSRMIGPGAQILSAEATEELMRLIKDRNDPERRKKYQFRELPHSD
jgi:hypothetical protein